MTIKAVGVDLEKNVFQLHGVDQMGEVCLRCRVQRAKLLEVVAQIEPCVIGIEACNSAYYWARQFERFGHTLRIISPQYDGNDAEAICVAVQQPSMRFVPRRSIEQQDVQMLHRARQRLVNTRTGLSSQIRGFLRDRGIAFARNIGQTRKHLPGILEDAENGLTVSTRETVAELFDYLRDLDERIAVFDRRIDAHSVQVSRHKESPGSRVLGPKLLRP
jgi:transposase